MQVCVIQGPGVFRIENRFTSFGCKNLVGGLLSNPFRWYNIFQTCMTVLTLDQGNFRHMYLFFLLHSIFCRRKRVMFKFVTLKLIQTSLRHVSVQGGNFDSKLWILTKIFITIETFMFPVWRSGYIFRYRYFHSFQINKLFPRDFFYIPRSNSGSIFSLQFDWMKVYLALSKRQ